MTPEELLQIIRTTTLAQLRLQVTVEYEQNDGFYDQLVRFVLAAKEQKKE